MGITLTNSKRTHDFDMGYSGFFNLRKNIAKCLDKEFGELYSQMPCVPDKKFVQQINDLIRNKGLAASENSRMVLDFLFETDCEGTCNYKVAGAIYEIIKEVDFGGKIFVYNNLSDGKDYEHLKEFFKETYSRRLNWSWS